MRVVGLNGGEYELNLRKYSVYKDDGRKRSKYHLLARKIISETLRGYNVLEEVKLPGSTASHKRSVLYLDFFIPNLMLAIEVHGRQHYEYVPFFHKTKRGFILAQARDEDKAEWCSLNNIEILVLKYSESENGWRNQISRSV
jgi:hypothetical protein